MAKNWLTERSINFYFATQLQLSAGLYKFDDINTNELLVINLAAVRADRNANTSSSPSPDVSSYFIMTLRIFIISFSCFFLKHSYSQTLKIAVFDLDSMVYALPEHKAVDSLVDMYSNDDSVEIAYEMLQNELTRIDETLFRHNPDYLNSSYRRFSDSMLDIRTKLALSLIYFSSTVEQNRKEKARRFTKPLYEKVNAAFLKVIENKKYDLILKPSCIVICDNCDNLFIEVARELKLSSLPENLSNLPTKTTQ